MNCTPGTIFVIGMGPGKLGGMTVEAKNAVLKADVLVGYKVYLELIKNAFSEENYDLSSKTFFSTGMGKEIERCEKCFDFAMEGKNVCMICSGDAGVYGMAEPVLSLQNANQDWHSINVCVIPGVTAALSGAAVLGSPLNHDFCIISLSDLLTPWEIIEKRLKAAVYGDFAIALYNPSSKNRSDFLNRACKILIDAGAEKSRACGYVQNIGREGETYVTCTLEELASKEVDMFTTVFIGNSQSQILKLSDGKTRLVTKRGYKIQAVNHE